MSDYTGVDVSDISSIGCSFRDLSNPVRLIQPMPSHQLPQFSPRILSAESSEIRDRAELIRVCGFEAAEAAVSETEHVEEEEEE